MPNTWASFLAELRIELDDTGATPRWTDNILYTFTRDGIWDYSQYFPMRVDHAELLSVVGNDKKFTLPASFLDDILVECPSGNYLEVRRERPGVKLSTSNSPLFYFVDAGCLYLDASPSGAAVLLSYYGAHGIPAAATDTTFALTIPTSDLEVLKLYVQARVNVVIRNRQSLLDRFDPGTGSRTDNPVRPETTDFFHRYNEAIAVRLRPQAIRLYRPRRSQ
jgi:hypothetical protein